MRFVLFVIAIISFKTISAQTQLDLVEIKDSNQFFSHVAYALEYSEEHEQALWVAYVLTKEETIARIKRSDRFIQDPMVKSESATDSDYKGSGYDRGHLAPAADMAWSQITMQESFYYSNMSPQNPGFNRGIWKRLESQVRSWAILYDSVLVVTGPVLIDLLPTVGPNEVSVPRYYFKALLDLNAERFEGIAFILPNEKSQNDLTDFVVSIDSLESLTQLNLYPFLSEEDEAKLETKSCISCWDWQLIKPKTAFTDDEKGSKQCSGLTKAGKRCSNQTGSEIGYCHIHTNQWKPSKRSVSVRCIGITQAGSQCKKMTLSQNSKCHLHGGN